MERGVQRTDGLAALPSISVAAHELKSPLTLMRQLSLLLGDASLSDQERAQYQAQLVLLSERSLALVSDVAQAANVQPSLFPLEPVNPFAVCRDIARDAHLMAELYNRRIQWPRSRAGVLMVANRRLVERIMANFLTNAVKYTEPTVPIRVVVQRLSGVIRLGVRDFGPQLTRREYRQLLDELSQRKTIKTRPESSGLGIFIASQFAEAMDGSIGLIRHRDGVTFYVELPVSRQMSLL